LLRMGEMADTDISLCMIVRNEAEALPACLEAASGLVRQLSLIHISEPTRPY